MKRILLCSVVMISSTVLFANGGGLYPDLQTVVPTHLNLVNKQGREILRFSNGVANTGAGPWQMRPEVVGGDELVQLAIQQILDSSGNVVDEHIVSEFEFHPEHNHWHIDGVAQFELRIGSHDGAIYGANSIKTTFCLIDWYKLDDNSPNTERTYFECNADFQGISPGWVDQYHQATEGQAVELTGAPAGIYYLVSTANADEEFVETDYTNNTAWVKFEFRRDSKGNGRLRILDHSECEGDMCGTKVPNR